MEGPSKFLSRLINGYGLGTIPFLISTMNIEEPEKPIDLPVVYRHSAIATNSTPSGHYRTNLARGNVQLGKSKSALDLASSKFEYNPNGESPTIETSVASLFANRAEGAETPVEESGDPPPLPPKPVAVTGIYETDNGRRTSSINPSYDISKGIAESAMDISLLTANANQLRLLITYNQGSKTYVACITFVILSLVLQMMVAITMIVVSLTKPERDDPKRQRVKIVTSIGVAIITMINILVASLVVAEQPPDAIVASTAGVVGILTNINITDTAART